MSDGPLAAYLPDWARYFVRCGYGLGAINGNITLVLTLPRREYAACLIATGAILGREQTEWSIIEGGYTDEVTRGDRVRYARAEQTSLYHGVVICSSKDELVLQDAREPGERARFGNDRRMLVVKTQALPTRRPKLTSNMPFLGELLGSNLRATSFCLRSDTAAVVIGNKGLVTDEGSDHFIDLNGHWGNLSDILRFDDSNGEWPNRSKIYTDTATLEPFLTDQPHSVLIIDGIRAWRRWNHKSAASKRVVLLDRSSSSFPSALEQVQADSFGTYLPFANDPEPPKGIEAYAFTRVKYGTL